MPVVIKGSDFVPAPDGVHDAVCVDVVDIGVVVGKFGAKNKIKIVWETAALMADGRRFVVQKWYTASLHEKSTLNKDLKSWRGKAFTPEELRGFDVEKVIGVPCQLVIGHVEKDGSVYADVSTVIKAGPNRLTPTGQYVRVKDRPEEQAKAANAGTGAAAGGGEEIPF